MSATTKTPPAAPAAPARAPAPASSPAPKAPAPAPPPPSPPSSGSSSSSTLSPRAARPEARAFEIESGEIQSPERILLYGPGGIGKTTAAAYLPAPLFVDLQDGSKHLNVSRVRGIDGWAHLRSVLASIAKAPPRGVQSVVIDTITDAEEAAKEYVIATRKTEKGRSVDSIEGFGWGKGWQFVYDEFSGFLVDCDRLVAAGLHVCLIAHDVSRPVPNPSGEDYLRWEPHLYTGDKKGRGSICERVFQWCDHALFVAYDVHATSEGKGQGSGSRTIYTSEMPTHRAKTRVAASSLPYELSDPGAIWRALNISAATASDSTAATALDSASDSTPTS